MENLLLRADLGPKASADLVSRVREAYQHGDDPVKLVHGEILELLGPDEPMHLDGRGLHVILVVGVNGSGKTTTIGKLAKRLTHEGKQVSMAASDTFRAAAGEQLEVWAEALGRAHRGPGARRRPRRGRVRRGEGRLGARIRTYCSWTPRGGCIRSSRSWTS